MAKYGGADIEALARVLQEEMPSGDRDWSMDLAYFLAMALLSLDRLEKEGIDLSFKARKLIEPSLKTAWRELVFIRRRRLSEEFVLNDIPRPVILSKRTGRILINEDHNRKTRSRISASGSDGTRTGSSAIPDWQRRTRIGGRPRFRRKRYKRKLSADATKLRGDLDPESD
jgi:hypothetical protein